jgi:hypothetical protein
VVTSPNATYVDSVATFNDAPLTTCGAQSGSQRTRHGVLASRRNVEGRGHVRGGPPLPGDDLDDRALRRIVTNSRTLCGRADSRGKKNNGNTLSSDQVATDLVAAAIRTTSTLRQGETARPAALARPTGRTSA